MMSANITTQIPIIAVLLLALWAGRTQAGDIYVDGVACQLGDAIIAANTDEAIFGCSAGDGPDHLNLLNDIPLQLGDLPSITSDITIISGESFAQQCDCNEDSTPDTPTPVPPANTPTPIPPSNTPVSGLSTATSSAVPPRITPTAPQPTGTPTPVSPSITPTALPSTGTPLPTATRTTITPTPAETPTVEPDEEPDARSVCIHMVRLGENLFRVALQYNFTVTEFSRFNNLLSNDRLLEGQELIIPHAACEQFQPHFTKGG